MVTASLVSKRGQKQHGDLERKLEFRRAFLNHVATEGDFFVPFLGDADIASALYSDRKIHGANLDSKRVKHAKTRLPDAEIVQGNCDTFPFAGRGITWALADFDSYAYPYAGFRAFWRSTHNRRSTPFVCLFTDGERQGISRAGAFVLPDGKHRKVTREELSDLYKGYFDQVIQPWFLQAVAPWKVAHIDHYYRSAQLYWGAVLEAPKGYKPGAKFPLKRQVRVAKNGLHRFDETKKEAYLELLRNGHRRGMAAEQVGITREAVWLHLEKNPAFAEAVSRAEMDSCEPIERALYETALAGNVTAQQVWLYNRKSMEWADKRNVTSVVMGPDGKGLTGPVIQVLVVDGQAQVLTQRIMAGERTEQPQLEAGSNGQHSAD